MTNAWVVVVDDDVISLKNARNMLVNQQMKVSVVRSGKELLTFLEKNRPDLILLDIQMPEMDGFETFRRVREHEALVGSAPIPVIFLTGDEDSSVERRGLRVGASDFVHKPFDQDVLITRIRNSIENARTIENLTEKASTDRLTGFLNKVNGTAEVEKLCRTETGALMIIDLDSFKLVNDLFGHEMGDRVLVSFADIVRLNKRSDDLICRIGGDEFLGFFRGVPDETAVASLTTRINDELVLVCEKLMGKDFGIPIGASVGVALVPEQGTVYDELFALADKALYQVKQNGKHDYMIYDPDAAEGSESDSVNLSEELSRLTQVFEERNDTGTAMWIGQDAFTWIYRHMTRFARRHNGAIMKLLFSLSLLSQDHKDRLSDAVDAFGILLQKVLRKNDVITRSKGNQYFLLLPDATNDNVQIIINRVIEDWSKTEWNGRVGITYAMEGLDYRSAGSAGEDAQ